MIFVTFCGYNDLSGGFYNFSKYESVESRLLRDVGTTNIDRNDKAFEIIHSRFWIEKVTHSRTDSRTKVNTIVVLPTSIYIGFISIFSFRLSLLSSVENFIIQIFNWTKRFASKFLGDSLERFFISTRHLRFTPLS